MSVYLRLCLSVRRYHSGSLCASFSVPGSLWARALDLRADSEFSRAEIARCLFQRGTIRGNTPRRKTCLQNGSNIAAVFFAKRDNSFSGDVHGVRFNEASALPYTLQQRSVAASLKVERARGARRDV